MKVNLKGVYFISKYRKQLSGLMIVPTSVRWRIIHHVFCDCVEQSGLTEHISSKEDGLIASAKSLLTSGLFSIALLTNVSYQTALIQLHTVEHRPYLPEGSLDRTNQLNENQTLV